MKPHGNKFSLLEFPVGGYHLEFHEGGHGWPNSFGWKQRFYEPAYGANYWELSLRSSGGTHHVYTSRLTWAYLMRFEFFRWLFGLRILTTVYNFIW